jgi:hypothetical protein
MSNSNRCNNNHNNNNTSYFSNNDNNGVQYMYFMSGTRSSILSKLARARTHLWRHRQSVRWLLNTFRILDFTSSSWDHF